MADLEDLVNRRSPLGPRAALRTGALCLLLACSADKPVEVTLPAGSADQPDIVLISVDTLRADHLSCYGHERPTSPFFDRLAAAGTRYSFARSASPWTLPAHTTMLTGQLPLTHKVVDDNLRLPSDVPVLPEVLKKAGYATGGFVATLYVSRMFGFERGFDVFNDFDIKTEKENLGGEVRAQNVVDEALTFWGGLEPGVPAFLFLHVYDAHYEYDPPGDYGTMFDRAPQADDPKYRNYFHFKKKKHRLTEAEFDHQRAQYDEAIRYVDDQMSRLEAAAEAAGRTVRFVITSDHGEEFGERGTWGHAHTLYAEQLHVPLIVSGPGLPAGVVVDAPVGTHDIAPTVASWVGGEGALQADGLVLSPEAEAAGMLSGRAFPAETTRFKTNRVGLYADGLRLEWDLKADRAELFDPHADPKEETDLARSRPEDLQRLKDQVEALHGFPWTATEAGTVKTGGVLLSKGRHKQLAVETGDRFLALPFDAKVNFFPEGQEKTGPFQANGGDRPTEGSGLSYTGSGGGAGASMTREECEALVAMGYMQDCAGLQGAEDAE